MELGKLTTDIPNKLSFKFEMFTIKLLKLFKTDDI